MVTDDPFKSTCFRKRLRTESGGKMLILMDLGLGVFPLPQRSLLQTPFHCLVLFHPLLSRIHFYGWMKIRKINTLT